MPKKDSYINPLSKEIDDFIKKLQLDNNSLEKITSQLFLWFNEYITYSRLNAPYHPLQRSDIDVLKMKSGTCGDYTNLIVSVLTQLGYQANYAYLKVDCYGNPQDHICAAVWDDNRWKLRKLKPSIPLIGEFGIPLKHEIEFIMDLCNK